MYTHPALAHTVFSQELEQAARDAERHRFALEHADQLRPRSRKAAGLRAARPSRAGTSCETATAC